LPRGPGFARGAGLAGRSACTACATRDWNLSVSPSAHGPVKAMVLDLDGAKAAELLCPLLEQPAGSVSIRDKLTAFAEAEGLQI